MKKLSYLLIIFVSLLVLTYCKKETSERFKLLTAVTWDPDTLLADGIEAGGPGGFLEKFNGDVKFNDDGTGNFGVYEGTWAFTSGETQIKIVTDSLPIPLYCDIEELTALSLKITTTVINPDNFSDFIDIRMTFHAK
jgi:hypothetical protein